MFKKLYSLLLLAFIITTLNAGNVDLLTARKVAEAFVKSHIPSGTEGLLNASSDFVVSSDEVPLYYIVNLNPTGISLLFQLMMLPLRYLVIRWRIITRLNHSLKIFHSGWMDMGNQSAI
jgi:hypothetical protein